MSTNFPTSLDAFTGPAFGSLATSDFIINLAQAVNALQAKVGADNSPVATSVDYKLAHAGGSGYVFASGFANYAPHSVATTSTVTTGRLNLSGLVCPRSITASNITGYAQAAGTSVTLFKYGIYALNASGDGTLIASTANQATAANAANGVRSYALSSPVALVSGTSYAIALLSVGGTAPQYACGTTTAFNASLSGIAQPFVFAKLDSQTDLPASFSFSGLAVQSFGFYQVVTT